MSGALGPFALVDLAVEVPMDPPEISIGVAGGVAPVSVDVSIDAPACPSRRLVVSSQRSSCRIRCSGHGRRVVARGSRQRHRQLHLHARRGVVHGHCRLRGADGPHAICLCRSSFLT